MEKLTYLNTIVNVLLVGWWCYRNNRLYISTSRMGNNDVLVGIDVMWNSYPVRKGICATGLFHIPIRNGDKIETRDKVMKLIHGSAQNRLQQLTAIFSWLKTDEEVQEFKKNYSIVDEKLVDRLVSEFNIIKNV